MHVANAASQMKNPALLVPCWTRHLDVTNHKWKTHSVAISLATWGRYFHPVTQGYVKTLLRTLEEEGDSRCSVGIWGKETRPLGTAILAIS